MFTYIAAVYMFPYVQIIYCTVYLCDIFFVGVNYYVIAVLVSVPHLKILVVISFITILLFTVPILNP